MGVIGRNVFVVIDSGKGESAWKVLAKVDTGAFSSSISQSLADKLELDDPVNLTQIRSASGTSERPCYKVRMSILGQAIETQINVANRTGLNYMMILGRKDIAKFKTLVDVNLSAVKTKNESFVLNFKDYFILEGKYLKVEEDEATKVKNIFKKGVKDKTIQYDECVNKSFDISVPRPKDWDDDISDKEIGRSISDILDIIVGFDSSVVNLGNWDSEEDEQIVLSLDTNSNSDMKKVLKWIKSK